MVHMKATGPKNSKHGEARHKSTSITSREHPSIEEDSQILGKLEKKYVREESKVY